MRKLQKSTEMFDSIYSILKGNENEMEGTKRSISAKKRWDNPESRKIWLEGIQSKSRRRKISEHSKLMWKDEAYRKKQAESRKKAWENEDRKKAHQLWLATRWSDPENKKALSEKMKAKWLDPEYNKHQLEVVRSIRRKLANRSKMTYLEEMASKIFEEFGWDYVFSGSKQIVGTYKPDFVHKRFKWIIEVNGGQHRDNKEYDKKRLAFIRSKGWKVLVLWYKTVADKDKAVKKIRAFHSRNLGLSI